ncbi:unnamed protein product [Trifolium pratense]|uniref:Uncharacterized protein n=1 Tax=Trifolium pratense TaxID=57577 RepID=A0ACB0K3B2_TRIPR|nr:unnamed protein product [Trifolium pratense]
MNNKSPHTKINLLSLVGRSTEDTSLLKFKIVELLFTVHLDDERNNEDKECGSDHTAAKSLVYAVAVSKLLLHRLLRFKASSPFSPSSVHCSTRVSFFSVAVSKPLLHRLLRFKASSPSSSPFSPSSVHCSTRVAKFVVL